LGRRRFHRAPSNPQTQKDDRAAGNRLVTAMQLALKDYLGRDNEQLTAFGIKPFRGRKRAKENAEAETPSLETADPSET
jgi:hypothetical protein